MASVWTWDNPHPQRSCPFFSPLPGEVRNIIFGLALTEVVVPTPLGSYYNLIVRHDHEPEDYEEELAKGPRGRIFPPRSVCREDPHDPMSVRHLWPGCEGPTVIRTALLRTCRRVYLETCHLPAVNRELCYAAMHPDCTPVAIAPGPRVGVMLNLIKWTNFTPPLGNVEYTAPRHAVSSIHRLRLFTPQAWLEEALPHMYGMRQKACAYSPSSNVVPEVRIFDQLRFLRFTIRCLDWRSGSEKDPLAIDPFGNYDAGFWGHWWREDSVVHAAMTKSIADDIFPQPSPGSWANAIGMMPNLSELVIDFETNEFRRPDLQKIVEWASTRWRFPVASGRPGTPGQRVWLTTEGNAVRKTSWQGFHYHAPLNCPACGLDRTVEESQLESLCRICRRLSRLSRRGRGPRLYVWTVKWTAKPEHMTIREAKAWRDADVSRLGRQMLPAQTEEARCEMYNYRIVF